MDFSLLLSSYATVWSNPEVLLMTFIGALGGVLLGAIPGMTATMGVALLIPFSFGMDLIPSIGLLLGIYCGGMYGGSISAILIHAPGTPAAAATLLDGYPMCKKGQAGKALSVAMFASFCGGVIGALVMTFLSPLVADMAMNFGPGEMFMLAVFGLSVIVAISGKSVAKGLISAFFGMLLCTVGLDPTNGIPRFITTKQTGLLDFILPGKHTAPSHLKVAFVHERTPGTSSWTSQHEFGRTQLDTVFEGKVETAAYFNAVPGKNADALVEQAITDGADVVFTTSPKLVGASLRAAVQHPQVHILNCSMEMPYASIRTYYTRVYEAKFITGAIAGAMAGGDRIGYVADYPSFGVPANINAFALGARMTNPNVRIDLQWTCLPDQIDPLHVFTQKGITVISGRDAPMPNRPQREFGTFLVRPGGVLQDLATPFWHWGQFYENVIRTVLNGGWVRDKSGTDGRAVNYWWGMNSGVMDVLLSRELPPDVTHLAQILRTGVTSGMIDPFHCRITGQDGSVKNSGRHGLDLEQIAHMDWLCDAVDGHIPEYDELAEVSKPMYRMQGIHRDLLPVEKEAEL